MKKFINSNAWMLLLGAFSFTFLGFQALKSNGTIEVNLIQGNFKVSSCKTN